MHPASRFLHFLSAGHDPNSPFGRPNRQRISIRLPRCAVYCPYLQKHSRCEASNHGNHVQNGPAHDLHKRNRSRDKSRVHVSSSEIVRINDANIQHFWEISAHTLQESCNRFHRVHPKCHMLLNIPSFSAQMPRPFSPHCLMSNPVLRQTDPFLPNDRQKDRTFPHPKARSRPLHGDARLNCGTFAQNSPTFSEKRGEISKKSLIFYFASPATRSKQPRKIGIPPQSHSPSDHFKQNAPSIKQKAVDFTKNISHVISDSRPTNTKHPYISSFMRESFVLRPKIIIFADISEQRSREAVLVPLTTRTL